MCPKCKGPLGPGAKRKTGVPSTSKDSKDFFSFFLEIVDVFGALCVISSIERVLTSEMTSSNTSLICGILSRRAGVEPNNFPRTDLGFAVPCFNASERASSVIF